MRTSQNSVDSQATGEVFTVDGTARSRAGLRLLLRPSSVKDLKALQGLIRCQLGPAAASACVLQAWTLAFCSARW